MEPKTIDQVRKYLVDLPITEGMDDVHVWAVILKVFTISYLDEQQISIGTDEIKILTSETDAPYTVSKTYIPTDPTKNFEGWATSNTSSIHDAKYDGETVNAPPYKMGTTMTISGDIVFTADAPKGNWLVFNENGKGATYNAPQFVRSGETTKPPAITMQRLGYKFGGWYTDQACTDGNEFTFGGVINERTNIYAKWTIVEKAPYVVLIWKQNVSGGNNYDFAESKTQTEATVSDQPITVINENNTIKVTGGGKEYTYSGGTGFKFASADTGKTVSPEGNTVVNVYFDRETVTLTFEDRVSNVEYKTVRYNGTDYELARVNNNTYVIKINEKWYQLTNNNTPIFNTGSASGPWENTSWVSADIRPGGSIDYDGPTWTHWGNFRANISSTEYTMPSSHSQTMSGLYGSTLEQNGYTWPSERWWYESVNAQGQGSGTRTTFLDAFLLSDGKLEQTFYGFNGNGSNHVYFQKESSDNPGEYTTPNDVTSSNGTFYISDKYNGYKAVSYSTNGTSWTQLGEKDATTGYYGSVSNYTNLYIRYSPLKYKILFEDGVYVDGDNNLIPETDQPHIGQLKVVEEIAYGKNISSFNKGQSTYYDPSTDHTVTGFVFEGWYIDDTCTQPYTFTTMPEGITVYAKWRQIQYRVFMHPNAKLPDGTNDNSLDWGDDDKPEDEKQAMNFRVDYLGQVSMPTGLRSDYEFIGWFLDEAGSIPFDDNSKLTEQIVTADYYKNTDFTDPMNKFGELTGPGSNSDLTGWEGQERFWITKKLDLYGKWSEVLTGAIGIGVLYDAEPGYNEPQDTKKYKDNTDAIAGTASTPSEGERFLYWVVQKYNSDTGEYEDTTTIVYPGAPFTVHKSWAKETDLADGDIEYKKDEEGNLIYDDEGNPIPVIFKAYTMQLRAEYGPAEVSKDTFIHWYQNEVGDAYKNPIYTSEGQNGKGLQINEATQIFDLASKEDVVVKRGHVFLGWARMPEYEKDSQGNYDKTKPIPYYADLDEDDLFLKYVAVEGETPAHYEAKIGDTWTTVTHLAADEKMPYHALYAVWEDVFYVVHGNGNRTSVDVVKLNDKRDRTAFTTGSSVDASGNVSYTSYYYGGYALMADTSDTTDPAGFKLTKGGAEATYTGSISWGRTTAQKSANAFDRTVGDVYYIKEVSSEYLASPKVATVVGNYGKGNLTNITLLSVIDTTIYRSGGIRSGETDTKGAIALGFQMTQNNGSGSYSADSNDLFGLDGYLIVNSWSLTPGTFTVVPYWVTYDDVAVYSNNNRSLIVTETAVTVD